MIFNYDFVRITSPSGMQDFGEFTNMDQVVKRLEELRKDDKLLATNHAVLMVCYNDKNNGLSGRKSSASYKLSRVGNEWVLSLPMPCAVPKLQKKK